MDYATPKYCVQVTRAQLSGDPYYNCIIKDSNETISKFGSVWMRARIYLVGFTDEVVLFGCVQCWKTSGKEATPGGWNESPCQAGQGSHEHWFPTSVTVFFTIEPYGWGGQILLLYRFRISNNRLADKRSVCEGLRCKYAKPSTESQPCRYQKLDPCNPQGTSLRMAR